MMKEDTLQQRLQIIFQTIVPHHPFSRLVGLLAHCSWGWLKNLFIWAFIRFYPVNMDEAQESDPYRYPTFNAFFIRPLKIDSRPLPNNSHVIISPVDGVVSEFGSIQAGQLLQAKQSRLSLSDLLGGNAALTQSFEEGDFINLYLPPTHYHRVHMPFSGTLKEIIHIPGTLYSVNPSTARHIPNLLAKNERVVMLFDTALGPMSVVMVGAMIVASISVRWRGVINPSKALEVRRWEYADLIEVNRGQEIGHFELGSTVLMFFRQQAIQWHKDLSFNQSVRMGQEIASIR